MNSSHTHKNCFQCLYILHDKFGLEKCWISCCVLCNMLRAGVQVGLHRPERLDNLYIYTPEGQWHAAWYNPEIQHSSSVVNSPPHHNKVGEQTRRPSRAPASMTWEFLLEILKPDGTIVIRPTELINPQPQQCDVQPSKLSDVRVLNPCFDVFITEPLLLLYYLTSCLVPWSWGSLLKWLYTSSIYF